MGGGVLESGDFGLDLLFGGNVGGEEYYAGGGGDGLVEDFGGKDEHLGDFLFEGHLREELLGN